MIDPKDRDTLREALKQAQKLIYVHDNPEYSAAELNAQFNRAKKDVDAALALVDKEPEGKRVAGISEDQVERIADERFAPMSVRNPNQIAAFKEGLRYFATHYGGQPSGNSGELSNEDIDTIAKFVAGPEKVGDAGWAERWNSAHSALLLYRDHISSGTPLPPTPSET